MAQDPSTSRQPAGAPSRRCPPAQSCSGLVRRSCRRCGPVASGEAPRGVAQRADRSRPGSRAPVVILPIGPPWPGATSLVERGSQVQGLVEGIHLEVRRWDAYSAWSWFQSSCRWQPRCWPTGCRRPSTATGTRKPGDDMKALVVYESHWGNTAAIARAIAEGIGPDTPVLATDEADLVAISGVDLLVAGAPVMGLRLPTEGAEQAVAKAAENAPVRPDVGHSSLRSWLKALPRGHGRAAAFETRVRWSPGGATGAIQQGLERAGYRTGARPGKFIVTGRYGPLREGELDRARALGSRASGPGRRKPGRELDRTASVDAGGERPTSGAAPGPPQSVARARRPRPGRPGSFRTRWLRRRRADRPGRAGPGAIAASWRPRSSR